MSSIKAIEKAVFSAIVEFNRQLPTNRKLLIDLDTELIGQTTSLDSIELVTLIVNVEQKVEEMLDIAVTLADERAMSQKHSPFKSLHSLVVYIDQQINEQVA